MSSQLKHDHSFTQRGAAILKNVNWHSWPSRSMGSTFTDPNNLGSKIYTSRKSRDIWNNRQVWPWSTKWSRTKANRVLPRKCTGHRKYPLQKIQEMTLHMDITRWSILKPDWLHSMQPKMGKLCTVSKSKTRSWLWLNHELLVAKFRLKLKNIGKTNKPFRYKLNQIPYDYIVKVTNWFKGLGLIDTVPEELWAEVRDIV